MSFFRSRWLWSIVGVAAGAWAVRTVMGNQQAKMLAARRSKTMWRRAARTGRAMSPSGRTMRPIGSTAMNMAAKAGRAMVGTTMRTVRAMNRG